MLTSPCIDHRDLPELTDGHKRRPGSHCAHAPRMGVHHQLPTICGNTGRTTLPLLTGPVYTSPAPRPKPPAISAHVACGPGVCMQAVSRTIILGVSLLLFLSLTLIRFFFFLLLDRLGIPTTIAVFAARTAG